MDREHYQEERRKIAIDIQMMFLSQANKQVSEKVAKLTALDEVGVRKPLRVLLGAK